MKTMGDGFLATFAGPALVVGSGLEFADRGAQTLKGAPGEWRLFAVSSES
ncbi:MAG TPA: hypothetical protein VFN85_05325 [Solirubrobacterales bacterium]|nr:hypothetical protein [Solirubrobacterales bacterium]